MVCLNKKPSNSCVVTFSFSCLFLLSFFFFFLSLIFWLFVAAIKQKLFLIRFLLSYLALPFFIQTVPKLIIVKQNLNRTGMESK